MHGLEGADATDGAPTWTKEQHHVGAVGVASDAEVAVPEDELGAADADCVNARGADAVLSSSMKVGALRG